MRLFGQILFIASANFSYPYEVMLQGHICVSSIGVIVGLSLENGASHTVAQDTQKCLCVRHLNKVLRTVPLR